MIPQSRALTIIPLYPTRLGTTWWKRWSTGNYAKVSNLTLPVNGICTKPEKKKTHKIPWDKAIETYTKMPIQKSLENYWMHHVFGPCLRTEKLLEPEGDRILQLVPLDRPLKAYWRLVWFGFFVLNGILIFVGYLMPKEESLTHTFVGYLMSNRTLSKNSVTYWPSTQPSIKEQVHLVEDINI